VVKPSPAAGHVVVQQRLEAIKACSKCGSDFVSKQATAAPAAAPAPAKAPNGAITVEQIKAVVGTVKLVGGTERLNELLGLVKEVGGLKKFKDLVDAITG
jgi:hypothetical protein